MIDNVVLQSCPDVELLPRIADIFEITLYELFERVSNEKEASEDVFMVEATEFNARVFFSVLLYK